MSRTYPFLHTWTDEDGIKRQAQIHQTASGTEAVWDARYPGDQQPWQDLTHESVRHEDIDDDGPED
ncbi:hypothetical protein ABTZ78_17200 [Streptomyces bauhiniae]|uniref:hypothetical protein n=1 Tax=Streptomyces bauhiniae TaxID=2340725 RepID=UPI0033193C97